MKKRAEIKRSCPGALGWSLVGGVVEISLSELVEEVGDGHVSIPKKRKTFVFDNKDKTLDLKVRTTDGVPEIVLKKGFAAARRREEIIIPLKTDSMKETVRIFSFLGHNKGIIAIRDNYIFNYKNIEFTLVKCPNGYCFYEAELINNKKIKNPERHIEEVLKSLNLRVWSEKEVYKFFMYCKKNIDKHFEYKI